MNYIEDQGYGGATTIRVCQEEAPHPQANFAIELMSKLAIATACPDGEDSAGRQKLRLLVPAEVVGRACEIAELSWQEFRARGWILDVPLPKAGVMDDGTEAEISRLNGLLKKAQTELKAMKSVGPESGGKTPPPEG